MDHPSPALVRLHRVMIAKPSHPWVPTVAGTIACVLLFTGIVPGGLLVESAPHPHHAATTTPKQFQTTWCFGKDGQHTGGARDLQSATVFPGSCHSVRLAKALRFVPAISFSFLKHEVQPQVTYYRFHCAKHPCICIRFNPCLGLSAVLNWMEAFKECPFLRT